MHVRLGHLNMLCMVENGRKDLVSDITTCEGNLSKYLRVLIPDNDCFF